MRRSPAPTDFEGWVNQLGITSCRPRAKAHLLQAGGAAVPALRRGLHHPKAIVRQQCVRIFDQLVDEESLADLVVALDDDDPGVCARALHALACDRCKKNACRPGEDLWVPRAIDFLEHHSNPDIRAAAIDALGKVADRRPDVVAVLEEAAGHDRNVDLRSMARHRLPQPITKAAPLASM
jgi:HEAT repeat protein